MVDVDIEHLREAAKSFNHYAESFRSVATPAVDRCQIPSTAIPILGANFGHEYAAGWQQLDLSIRAMPDLLDTLGRALTRVADHYEHLDAANASQFTAPGMPPPRDMSTSPGTGALAAQIGTWGITGLTTAIGDLRMLSSAGGLLTQLKTVSPFLKASALPYGAVIIAAVLAVDVFATSNMREPVPYFTAGEGWSQIEGILNTAVADLPRLSYDVVYKDPQWTGDGAAAFYAFINDDLHPALSAMVALNNSMQAACIEAGLSMTFAIVSYIAISITTGVVCNLAKLVPDPTTATQLSITTAALAMFMEYTVEILVSLGQMYMFLTLSATQMKQASDTLKQYLVNKDGQLDGGSLRLSVPETQSIAAWEDWTRKEPKEQ